MKEFLNNLDQSIIMLQKVFLESNKFLGQSDLMLLNDCVCNLKDVQGRFFQKLIKGGKR